MKTVMISSLVEKEKLLKRVIYQKSVGIIWNKKSKELDRCVSMDWWWWIAHPTISPGGKGAEDNSLHHSLKNSHERTPLKNLWTVPSKQDWGEGYELADIYVKVRFWSGRGHVQCVISKDTKWARQLWWEAGPELYNQYVGQAAIFDHDSLIVVFMKLK